MPDSFATFNDGSVLTAADLNTLVDAIVELQESLRWFGETTGTGNNYLLSIPETIADYADGQLFLLKANRTSNGPVQLNVNSKGLKEVRDLRGIQLNSEAIQQDAFHLIAYHAGDFFVCLNPCAPTAPVQVDNETPGGTVDGINTSFTLANSPSPEGSLLLFLNGAYQVQDTDYTLTGDDIEFSTPPPDPSTLRAHYRY